MTDLMQAALDWGARFAIFPCKNMPHDEEQHKAPWTRHGFKDASRDPEQIRRWWTLWPDALIGMPTGEVNKISIIDLDVKRGKNGLARVPDWEQRSSAISRTQKGGAHLWYRHEAGIGCTSDQIAPGVDTRGEGGYVIVPPSEGYSWHNDHEPDLTNLPPWPEDLRPLPREPRMRGENSETETGTDLVAFAVAVIPNADVGWDEWKRIGMAIYAASGGSQEGFEIFDKWSQKSGKYVSRNTIRAWDQIERSPPTQIGAGTLFHLANEACPGWGNEYDRWFLARTDRAARDVTFEDLPKATNPWKDAPTFAWGTNEPTAEFKEFKEFWARAAAVEELPEQEEPNVGAEAQVIEVEALKQEEPATSIPFMITLAMKDQLRACGFSDDQIANLTPQEAHEILAKASAEEVPKKVKEPPPRAAAYEIDYAGLPAPWSHQKKVEPKNLVAVKADEVETREINWLWPNRIARGKLTLFAGLPDTNKSTLGIDVIAKCTTGQIWPNSYNLAPICNAIILSAEDDPADTIVPRLVVAGADLARVRIVKAVMQGEERALDLYQDMKLLEDEARSMGEVGIIMVDPVSAYMGKPGATNSHRDTDVRAVLFPLKMMLERIEASGIGIMHLNKESGQTSALMRIMGSIGHTGAARAAYLIIQDPENKDKDRRFFLRVKNNLAKRDKVKGLAFNVVEKLTPEGMTFSAQPKIEWEKEEVEVTADEALAVASRKADGRRSEKAEEAEAMLRELLANGPRKQAEIMAEADARLISRKSLRTAASHLKIRSEKEQGQMGGPWFWVLPPKDPGPY